MSVINAFALSGRVQNMNGEAVEGAKVSLGSDTSINEESDAAGAFTIDNSVSIGDGEIPGTTGPNLMRLALKGDRLHFFSPEPAHAGALSLLAGDGRKSIKVDLGRLKSGAHQMTLPKLAPGLYIMRITLGSYSGTAYLVHTGNGAILIPKATGSRNASADAGKAPTLRRMAATETAMDTLRVEKTGYSTAKIPITSYDQTDITVELAPYLPPTDDYDTDGPFDVVSETNVGPGGNYMIFRPDPLGEDGFLHAPVIYGYGINGQIRYAADFLEPLASHGFVIIGCNILTGGPNDPGNNAKMTDGLNWLLEQNSTAGSKYEGKLAVNHATSMGYSVGGTAAVDIGGHEAIQTVVSIHGHISDADLHGTLLQTTGTRDNIGLPMQQQTFENSNVQTFLGTVTDADHGYPGTDGGVQRPAIIAWLRYWIYKDTGAKHYFYGDDCVMCRDPWENPQRKNWE